MVAAFDAFLVGSLVGVTVGLVIGVMLLVTVNLIKDSNRKK